MNREETKEVYLMTQEGLFLECINEWGRIKLSKNVNDATPFYEDDIDNDLHWFEDEEKYVYKDEEVTMLTETQMRVLRTTKPSLDKDIEEARLIKLAKFYENNEFDSGEIKDMVKLLEDNNYYNHECSLEDDGTWYDLKIAIKQILEVNKDE